jgi:2-keto-4-pentenoate hydratase/2-oxohepta-3-ene-1,7-dioic acid hydratase in catechol pathway
MVFPVPELIAEISSAITLEPGDVISTGTPAGVGYKADPPRFLTAGDEVTITIESIGSLTNRFVASAGSRVPIVSRAAVASQ